MSQATLWQVTWESGCQHINGEKMRTCPWHARHVMLGTAYVISEWGSFIQLENTRGIALLQRLAMAQALHHTAGAF